MDISIQQLQLGSLLKNEKKAKETLDLIKKIGFDSIELNGFMIRKNPPIVKLLTTLGGMTIKNSDRLDWIKLLEESGLKVISIHEDLKTLETRLDFVMEECRQYRCKYVVITGNYQFFYSDRREMESYCLRLNDIGRKLKANNISFLYHNHNAETQRIDKNTLVYDLLIALLNREYVNFELDSYWFSISGMDTIKIMKNLKDRIVLHHICDSGKRKKGKDITPIIKTEEIECNKGCLNLEDMIRLDKENQCKAIILEQHKNFIHNDVIESASLSFEYLSLMRRNLS